jgi:hypothetical protein
MKLPLRVTGRESSAQSWTETTYIFEATQLGAGIILTRPIEPGRLIHLSLPLPTGMRAYDYFKVNYQIWGLVRYILAKPPDSSGMTHFSIGVAFVGQRPPVSYEKDPTTLYDLKPMRAKNGLWILRERMRKTGRYIRQSESRYTVEMDVSLEVFDEHGMVVHKELGHIKNISVHGAAIQTKLWAQRGSFIRMTSEEKNISVLALTRGCHQDENGLNYLHLEFIDREWPSDTDS